MCGSKIGKIINKVTSLHDKLDPITKPLRDKAEDSLGLPRSGEIGTAMFPDAIDLTGSTVESVDNTPSTVDAGVLAAKDDERRRRAASAGQNSTILTGSNGLSGGVQTGRKTLLGA